MLISNWNINSSISARRIMARYRQPWQIKLTEIPLSSLGCRFLLTTCFNVTAGQLLQRYFITLIRFLRTKQSAIKNSPRVLPTPENAAKIIIYRWKELISLLLSVLLRWDDRVTKAHGMFVILMLHLNTFVYMLSSRRYQWGLLKTNIFHSVYNFVLLWVLLLAVYEHCHRN